MNELILGGVFLFCLLISAMVSAGESALTSITKLRARRLFHEDDPQYMALERWFENPNRYLVTILACKTAFRILSIVVLYLIVMNALDRVEAIPSTPWIIAGITVPLAILIQLIFGEIVPKTWGKENAVSWSRLLMTPLNALGLILSPFVTLMVAVSNPLIRLLGCERINEVPLFTEDDIRTLVEMSEREGVLVDNEREMIHSIIDFGETQVKEIMTPRVDLLAIPIDLDLKSVRDQAIEYGHSRIPVYVEDFDHIAGVLYAKDLLRYDLDDPGVQLKNVIRPPLFVPRTKMVSELLDTFKKEKTHMALVVDEYGLTAGLVTIEDVLEEIVGDIQDEYDNEPPEYKRLPDGRFEFDAKIDLDIITELLDVEFPEEDVETLGGFLSSQVGHVPEVGEEVTYETLHFTVIDADERRVKRVHLVKLIENDEPTEESSDETTSST